MNKIHAANKTNVNTKIQKKKEQPNGEGEDFMSYFKMDVFIGISRFLTTVVNAVSGVQILRTV